MLIFGLQMIANLFEVLKAKRLALIAKGFDAFSLILYQAAIYYVQA
jgi:hypothetical protein